MKLYIITILFTALFSCSKSGSGDDPSREQALTTGSWILTAAATDYNKDGTYEEDTYAILAGCEKDNIYTFQPGGTLVKDEGATKCISGNPQVVNLTWSLKNNRSVLQFSSQNYDIEELTQTTMKLKGTASYNVIYTVNVRSTYSRQ